MADWKNLTNKAKNLTYVGLGKAKELGETAKLNLDNVSEEENKKRIYAEIGKRYVLENPVAEEGFADLYAQLEEIEARIAANKARLDELK
ncbi:MAG: serine proteinase [Ruminiclostridium sp.]|nr:serine proteinase [Ruminiclostridium sp.]